MGQSSSPPPSPSLSEGAEPTLGQLFLSGSTNVKGDIQSFLARLARSPQVLAEEAKEHHARTHRRIRRRRKPPTTDADAAHDSAQPSQALRSAAQPQQQQQQRPLWTEPMRTTVTNTTQQQQPSPPAHVDQGPPRKRARPTLARAPQPHAVDDHGVLRRAPPVPILPQQQQAHHPHYQLHDEPELEPEPRYRHQSAGKRKEEEEEEGDDEGEHERRYRARERHHSTPSFLSRPEPSSSGGSSSLEGNSASMPDLGPLLQGFPSFPYAHHPSPSPSPASLLNDSLSLDVNRLIYDIGDYCLSLCSDISLICSSPPPPARPTSPAPPPHSAFSRPFPPSSSLSSSSSSSSSGNSSGQYHQQQLHHGGIGHGPPHTACPSSPATSRPPHSPYTTANMSSSSQCSSAVSSPYLPSPPPSFSLGVTVSSPPALQDQCSAAGSTGRHPTFPMHTSFYAEEPFYQPAPPTPEEATHHSRHASQPQPHHHHHPPSLSSRRHHQPHHGERRDDQATRPPTETRSKASASSDDAVAQMSEADEVAALIRDFLQEEGEAPEDTQFDSSLLYSSPTGRSRRRLTPPPSSSARSGTRGQ